MDEMKLESKFTTGIVSKLAEHGIKSKFGYDIGIQLNHFRTTVIDGKTHVHLDVDLDLGKEDLSNLLSSINL